MKLKRYLLALSLALTISHAYAASQPDNLGGFDFNYSVDLNKSIGLTQVFDDGDRTYFQFTQAENLPTLYSVNGGKKQQINYEIRPPYIIATGVASKYALATNGGKTTIYVSYNGKRQDEVPVAQTKQTETHKDDGKTVSELEKESVRLKKSKVKKAVKVEDEPTKEVSEKKHKELITGSMLNVPFFENSISMSKKAKDDLTKATSTIVSSSRIVVRGRPSVGGDEAIANTRAIVIKNFLIDLGVDEESIETTFSDSVKQGKNQGFYLSEVILLAASKEKSAEIAENKSKQAKVKQPVLDIKAGDLISTQLIAWAKRYNYTLQWEADEYRATAPLTLAKDFNETLDAVIGSMKINGVFLDITTYENNIVRVVETK